LSHLSIFFGGVVLFSIQENKFGAEI